MLGKYLKINKIKIRESSQEALLVIAIDNRLTFVSTLTTYVALETTNLNMSSDQKRVT